MPADQVQVARVDMTTHMHGVKETTSYLVTGTYADGRLDTFQASTASAWIASICLRALECHTPAVIIWHAFGRWKRINRVELSEQVSA